MNRKRPRSPSKNAPRGASATARGPAPSPGASAKKRVAALTGKGATAGPGAAAPRKRSRPRAGHAEPPPPPGAGRLIRRYGNRRLYDLQLSRCVTAEEVAAFVHAGDEVRVVDADSGVDITRRILVQLLLEERNRELLDLLPVSLLRGMLTDHSEQLSGWLEQYLAAGGEWMQRASRQATRVAGPTGPWPVGLTMPGYGVPQPRPDRPAPGADGPPASSPDAELRRRLDELERTLSDLRQKKR